MIIRDKVKEYLKELQPQNVLDLGCGKGHKSLRFAKQGVKVLGVDKRPMEISQKNFKFFNEDITNFEFKEKYDLIIASLVLHFLDKVTAQNILKKIQTHTSEQGHTFIICFSDKDPMARNAQNRFYPSLKQLKNLYSDWEIMKEGMYETPIEEHDNLPPHKHNVILLLLKNKQKA